MRRNKGRVAVMSMSMATAGAGGDPPRKQPGKDPFQSGHYAPTTRRVTPLKGIKMADPRETRNVHRARPNVQAPMVRRRANSMPALSGDKQFYHTFRSVMTQGILSQTEMRQRGIGFNPSHDESQRDSDHIEVTRVQGGLQKSTQDIRTASTRSVTNPHHGALSVALESGANELDVRRQTVDDVRRGLNLDQRLELLMMPNDASQEILNAQRRHVLTPQATGQAEERMHSNFMVMSRANSAATSQAYEETRPSITPGMMQQVSVPQEHMSTARQVLRDMNVREHQPFPSINPIPSTQNLSPDYRTRRGNTVSIQGISAPSYQHSVSSQLQRGDTDIHLVRTGVGRGQGPRQVGRPRSKTI